MDSVPKSRHNGFTLIELVMFIVVVGAGLAGILVGINRAVASSADPMARKQALAIAQSMLEEVALQAFTYCDPDDPNAETATSPAGCTTTQAAKTAGETRFAVPQFDNVMDYNGYSMSPIVDITNSPIAGLGAYTATVLVQTTALSSISAASGDALLIRVTVNGPGSVTQVLEGYRTRYAPNAAP